MKTFGFKVVFIIILFLVFSCEAKKENEVIRVVFYKISTDIAKNIEETLIKQFSSNDEKIELLFEQISDFNKLKERVEKDENVSLIFSNTIHLPFESEKASPFDVSLYETFPSCIKRYSFESLENNAEGAISLPILLDTYHLFFHKIMFENGNERNFYDVDVFSDMLKEVSGKIKYPILCAGGEDDSLLFFVASVMQMVGDVYSIKNKKIKSLKDREEVFNKALGLIVEWQKSGFLHPEWFRLKYRDVSMFTDLEEIGVLFTKMSEYKEMKSETKNFYSLLPYMPLSKDVSLNGIPISIISIIEPLQKEKNTSTLKSNYISKIIEYCISVEGQAKLSERTGFTSSSISNANQNSISSIRYVLATVSVVLGDVASIILEDPIDSTVLAKEIRDYLQVNGVGY